ncbi:UvrD-helicase domain-containing protein [Christensenella tenuis]|uniref:ATP-dependent helicase n=1 Tax=Christensenella tenuis TaxID=2763033 RepID=A0ABR7EES3_9FIRM|nr:UvrD-helicase domain-containing protein [Christensenella tenuis]MBC5647529.1 ATP-dependent helicase [Christensenella tenuis]
MEDIKAAQQLSDNHIDDHVDDEIKLCLSDDSPKSFFMFAGAGSGKTRSLINALSFLDKEMGSKLSAHSKQVAVITYTNAACDEISKRLQYKPVFAVSTIHSFLWELIKNYQLDIKAWVIESLKKEIAELNEKQTKGRGGDAAVKRESEIKRKTTRLAKIETVKKFSYNPNGDNVGYDSLSHSEVVKMGSEFIAIEETMQEILVGKYPVLLIDESQDTKKELVDALLIVYEKYKDRFVIGMFGDTMQRIYMDGKDNLACCIPDEWEKPKKVMNHRSATRIVELANAIRKTIDKQEQRPRSDADRGTVRLFIVDSSANKEEMECRAAQIMAKKANDKDWLDAARYKSLILEHHMAASRFGFFDLYAPLNESKSFDTSLRDGSISEISFLSNVVSPLVKAHQSSNDFEVSRIVRQHSPLLDKKAFQENSADQTKLLETAENAVEELLLLWKCGATPTCIEILKAIKKTNLFTLNDRVDDILSEPVKDEDKKTVALREALSVPFDELEKYSAYVTDNTQFATHQGVKGREFPRVMVIMDDTEAKGFLFSYEKLFGAKSKTETDIKNEREGKDTGIMRTTRLFYVACTRAEKSLAVVAYTENKQAVKNTAISNGWFSAEEIEFL